MCGICGVMYPTNGPDLKHEPSPSAAAATMLRDMLHRGRDATGWMYPEAGSVEIRKLNRPAAEVNIIVPDDVQWFAGHVRMATHGTPANVLNNHPIVHRQIVGVHNGIIRNHAQILARTGREDHRAEVDSEALFAAIATRGARRGLERVRGDFATAWADTRWHANQLYLARNAGRPIWIGEAKTGSTYFASEEPTLKALGVEFTALYPFKPNTYAALTPDGWKWTRHFTPSPMTSRSSRTSWSPKPAAKGKTKAPVVPLFDTGKPVAGKKRNPNRPWYLQDDFEFPVTTRYVPDAQGHIAKGKERKPVPCPECGKPTYPAYEGQIIERCHTCFAGAWKGGE